MADQAPVDAAGTPDKQQLYAVFDSEQEADRAEQALSAQGSEWRRLQGQEAAHDLNQHDEDTVTGKIGRFIKGFGGEDLEAKRYSVHTQNGQVVLTVPCQDQETAQALTRLLTPFGAYDVTYFSNWTMEHMSPAANAAHGMPTYESATEPDELNTRQVP